MSDLILRSERLLPEVRAFLESLDAAGAPPLSGQDPAMARNGRLEFWKKHGGESVALGQVEDRFLPGPGGDVPVRVYAKEQGEARPAAVYFHGGGFVFGNLDSHDAVCRDLADKSGAVVIAVDYRLAPEHKYPSAIEDAHSATFWVADNAHMLGIDPRRIAVVGDSAGGTLAAVIAMRSRDAGGPDLALQVLIFPITDFSSFETGSYREFGEKYFLTRDTMNWFKGHYLRSASLAHQPEASPLLAPDLSRLPPALVITAEFDPLRDEGEAYAERMRQAGVPVTLTRYPGTIHGFVSMRGKLAHGRTAIEEAALSIRSMKG
jgi:acetyl esterase